MTDKPEAFESILPPLDTAPKPTVQFNDDDLSLIRRVLTFADAQVPIEDQLGAKIYPTEDTRRHARALEARLDDAGIAIPKGLYTAFDPFEARDKIGTVHYFDDDGYEYYTKGLVTGVEQLEDGTWELRLGKSVARFDSVEVFKANVSIELDPV